MNSGRIKDSNTRLVKLVSILALILTLILFYIIGNYFAHTEYNGTVEYPSRYRSNKTIAGHTDRYPPQNVACPTFTIDVNDSIVKDFIKNVTFSCPKTPAMTQLNQKTGLLKVSSKVRANADVTCYYSFMWSTEDFDNYIDYSGFAEIPDQGVKMSLINDLVNVSCYSSEPSQNGNVKEETNGTSNMVYFNSHMYVPDFRRNGKSGAPSVIVFFMESMPKLSFYRFMPKTVEALKSLGNVQIFNNFVKPMDNSFPNSMAAMAGMKVDMSAEAELKEDYFDNKLPYVWDEYKKNGYITGFLEDMAQIGVFNYGR